MFYDINKEENTYKERELILEEFLTENEIAEEMLLEEIKNSSDLTLDIAIGKETASFVVRDRVAFKRIATLGVVPIKTIIFDENGINHEAFRAQIIATALFDKVFGEESQKNICRNQYQYHMYFNDKLKEIVKIIQQ